MYAREPQHLNGFMDFVKKVRKVVHKIHPRELSPTRLIEKYQSDSAKKATAKQARVAAQTTADIAKMRADAQASLASQVQAQGLASSSPLVAAQATSDNTLLYAAAGGLALVLLLAMKKKGRR